jgi:hypothetical protein
MKAFVVNHLATTQVAASPTTVKSEYHQKPGMKVMPITIDKVVNDIDQLVSMNYSTPTTAPSMP